MQLCFCHFSATEKLRHHIAIIKHSPSNAGNQVSLSNIVEPCYLQGPKGMVHSCFLLHFLYFLVSTMQKGLGSSFYMPAYCFSSFCFIIDYLLLLGKRKFKGRMRGKEKRNGEERVGQRRGERDREEERGVGNGEGGETGRGSSQMLSQKAFGW